MSHRFVRSFLSFIFISLLSFTGMWSCAPTLFPIGGTVSGLSGTLVLQNNGGDNLSLTVDEAFTFATGLALGSSYSVTVLTQPSGQTCTVTNGTGVVSATVSNIQVTCSSSSQTYTLGGTVTGLSGTVVLVNSDAQEVSVSSDGSFEFANALADGTPYSVSVQTQPSGQTCSVSEASGIIDAANVSNVAVVCSADTFTVGGTASGLTGTVVLQNNGGDDLSVTSDGSFTFSTPLADGAVYAVSILTQPSGQLCEVTDAGGTISGANVIDVTVTCADVLIIYYTSGNYGPGASGGFTFNSIASADAKCMSDFAYPGTGTYEALLVDGISRQACSTASCGTGSSEHIDWVLQPNTTYVQSDGATVIGTTDSNGIFPFPLENNFTTFTSGSPWTGLETDWTNNINNCVLWASNLPADNGQVGDMGQTTSSSISLFSLACSQVQSLLCVQQP